MRRRIGTSCLAAIALLAAACLEGPSRAQQRDFDQARSALELPSDRPLNAAFLVVEGVYNTELTAPLDILQHTVHHTPPGIRTFTVSPDGGQITTAEGLKIVADYGFDDVPPIDILVVPSAEHSRDTDLDNERLVDWVAATGREARFVMSLCWGAFVLAEAGLLDEREATTFPSDYQSFLERFPKHRLHVNVSFVHDGPAITSQGGARSFDPAMYLVDLLYGTEVAARVGAGLLIEWPMTDTSLFVTDPVYARQMASP